MKELNVDEKIEVLVSENNPLGRTLKLIGPLGIVEIIVGHWLISVVDGVLNFRYDTPPTIIGRIKQLEVGLIRGYRTKLYQSGVWTIMKKMRLKTGERGMKYQLGYSHGIYYKMEQGVLYKSRRDGQLRKYNIFSVSLDSLGHVRRTLVQLKPADPYRLNGFRYATDKMILKIGKKK